jgi:coenzyme F420-dependent glucose-6-phosphate dehydrogenase
MAEFGYKLSSEEHGPRDLVRYARDAEQAGFSFAAISDHFHPWTDKQGHAPFVWGVIGGIAQVTERLTVGTGVTCPTIRTHPAIVAHAAATAGAMLPGRFWLGVGTGENLNEHVHGDRWPAAATRREMLEEAIEVIRRLWEGGNQSHDGKHYTVENAQIYDVPDEAPPIYVAASGEEAVKLAGRAGDGLISLAPDEELLQTFDDAGGTGKPRLAEVQVCWHTDEVKALQIALEWWPNMGLGGELSQELPLPRHFEQAVENVSEDDIKDSLAYGPDPQRHIDMIKKYVDAGYTHVWVHQIGPDQDGFFDFYATEVLPKIG